MNRFASVCVSVAFSAFAVNCVAAGNDSVSVMNPELVDRLVVDGTTTMGEVMAIYGLPFATHQTKYGTQLVYAHADLVAPSPLMKTVVVEFDKSGVASSHSYQEARR